MKKGKDRIITFTTDFGAEDPYAAIMKGVVHTINHRVRCIDITHGIKAHDVSQAAFTIGTSYHWFPEGTIHVVVVDPGVGTGRRVLVAKAAGHTFVGPDNGVFSLVYNRQPVRVHQVTNNKYMLPTISQTFHGRDIFSPLAAWLSKGVQAARMGPEITDYVRLPFKEAKKTGKKINATVMHIDTFGNVVTNVPAQLVAGVPGKIKVTIGQSSIRGLSSSYTQGEKNKPLAIIGASGFLEIACREASAAKKYKLKVKAEITVELT